MKKRILSAIALTMAMTLTLGMTAFAEESPDIKGETIVVKNETANVVEPTGDEKTTLDTEAATLATVVTTVDATDAKVSPISAGELKNAKEVAAKMAVAAKGEGATYKVLAAADVVVDKFDGGAVTITLKNAVDPTKIIVMHLNKDNVWEVMKTDVSEDGKTLKAYFKDLSPIVVVEVAEKAGETNPPANNTNNNTTTNTTPAPAPAESPKTGAAMSVAGILALVCLAGVAVSAKKVRYNR